MSDCRMTEDNVAQGDKVNTTVKKTIGLSVVWVLVSLSLMLMALKALSLYEATLAAGSGRTSLAPSPAAQKYAAARSSEERWRVLEEAQSQALKERKAEIAQARDLSAAQEVGTRIMTRTAADVLWQVEAARGRRALLTALWAMWGVMTALPIVFFAFFVRPVQAKSALAAA